MAYLDDEGVTDRDERQEFQHYVRSLDGKYLELVHDKMNRERERLRAKAEAGSKGRR